jgi:hypothetical protein
LPAFPGHLTSICLPLVCKQKDVMLALAIVSVTVSESMDFSTMNARLVNCACPCYTPAVRLVRFMAEIDSAVQDKKA